MSPSITAVRNAALRAVAQSGQLTPEEVSDLKVSSYARTPDWSRPYLSLEARTAVVILPEEVARLLDDYLERRRQFGGVKPHPRAPLFLDHAAVVPQRIVPGEVRELLEHPTRRGR